MGTIDEVSGNDLYNDKNISQTRNFWYSKSDSKISCLDTANIAEGWGRMSPKEFKRFCQIARGSASELETHLLISSRLKLITKEELTPIWNELQNVQKLLNGLIRSIKNKLKN